MKVSDAYRFFERLVAGIGANGNREPRLKCQSAAVEDDQACMEEWRTTGLRTACSF